MQVGFIGLGRMGAAMALNLIKAGHDVTVFNRTPDKARALAAEGAKVASTVAEACRGEAVVTMLADDEALAHVAFGPGGIVESLRPGALHISSSTVSVALSQRLAGAHEAAGQRYVAAPVFGRPEAAAAAKLFVVAAGDEGAIGDAQPLFDAIGQKTFVFSDVPEKANLIKLSGNFLIGCVIETLGEALALVGKAGIDRHQYLDFLTSTLFNAPIYKTYGALIADPPGAVGFAAPLGLKDVKLALSAADELKVPLPVASLLRDRFLALIAQDGADLDWSAIGKLPAREAGLPQG